MTLSDQQIEQLYQFTRKHYVVHYDLQTELVDHLANDIEAMLDEEPSLTFENARDRSFKKFGVTGFLDVVEAKKKEMSKKYWKVLIRFLEEWFTIPKIILTLLLFSGLWKALQYVDGRIWSIVVFFVLLFSGLIFDLIAQYKISERKRRKQRIFLFEEIIFKTKWSILFLVVMHVVNAFSFLDIDFVTLSQPLIFLMAVFLTFFFLTFIITQFTIPNRAEELLKEQYPEYKFV